MTATFDLKIIVYTSTDCPKCKHLKMQLRVLGISFEEKNIDIDKDAITTLLMKGVVSVPVIEVNEKIMTLEELKEYLEDEQ